MKVGGGDTLPVYNIKFISADKGSVAEPRPDTFSRCVTRVYAVPGYKFSSKDRDHCANSWRSQTGHISPENHWYKSSLSNEHFVISPSIYYIFK